MYDWSQLSFTVRWPHQGIMVGYEFYEPTLEENYITIKAHLFLLTVNYEFGYGDSPYDE